ncbi:coiled-coil domain-containing protein 60-like isoform X2 [Morone saxatilis]|uniref:coiled-coil domain-containing protein 60-like isoform X2 n=1 Tax=Morone saxatilis TaxID=34816 RepID=UPI0015E1DBDB|nr:coiled-coil domain-containing protein 60-like isoform X2 [Morone saxatilis]
MTSRVFGRVKPALVCEQEVSARSTDSRENHDRRALQLSRQGCLGAPRRPSGSLSRLSHPKSRPVNMGQQRMGTSLPVSRTQAGKRADIVSLRKHLGHARRLASAIKRGQSYFHLLQKEEREEQEVEESQQMRKEEQLRREPRPPRFSSDSDSESEGWPVPAGTSWSSANEARLRRRKSQSARPFTPVHHSLISPLLSEAPRKVIYRQLCCLNWLLEALTLDPSGRVGPLAACWDPKDPGRGRTMIKTLKKERAIENKWEQFVSTKPQRVHRRHPRSSSARLHTHRKSSFASVASLSAFTSTTVGSSVSSLVPGTEEGTECPAAAEETEQPPSECLRTLSDVHQKVKKKNQSSRHTESLTIPESKTQPLPQRTDNQSSSKTTMSCPAKPPLAISHLINNRATMLRDVKAVFDERVEELAQSYIDALELKARKRLNSGLQMYQGLSHMTEPHGFPHHVTCMSQETEAPHNNKNNHNNNMWLSTLLSSLPEKVYRERAVSRVLEKLSGFAEQQTLRVRPQLFLKVLGGLEPWELCLPEMCVAIQIATKHVVQMSREQYDAWLRSRVTLPPQYPMPLKHQVNHTHQDLEEGYRHRQLD